MVPLILIMIILAIGVGLLIWRGFATGDRDETPAKLGASTASHEKYVSFDVKGDFQIGNLRFSKQLLVILAVIAVLMFLIPPMNTLRSVPVFDGWHPISMLGSDSLTMTTREIAFRILWIQWGLLCLIGFVTNAIIRRD